MKNESTEVTVAMKMEIYEGITDDAKEVRTKVFINEQGYSGEFDDTDETAVHFVIYDENNTPVATCRIFWDSEMNSYVLGRLAVIKEYRGKNLGSAIVKEAEQYIQKIGGTTIILHAQCRASAFYKKAGYTEFSKVDDDEGHPHIWMRKKCN